MHTLREEFEAIDTDGSGYIELNELKAALEADNKKIDTASLQNIIDNLDYANNDKINYSEFIAATLDIRKIVRMDEGKLVGIFNSFDVDNTGYISRENLKIAFSKFGREITDEDMDEAMKKHDKKKNDQIDFQEFKDMLEGL